MAQYTPGNTTQAQTEPIHFCAGVGALVPCRHMPAGEYVVYMGKVPSLASPSTRLLP